MQELTQLAQTIPSSPTIAMADKAKRLIAAGEDVIAMAGGEPDFDTPAHIVAAGVEALQAGRTRYAAPSKGITPLTEAIAAKLEKDNGITVNPGTDVLVTPGGKLSLYLALKALLNPGDEVLLLQPAWVSYASMVMMLGATPASVYLDSTDNFTITEEKLRATLTDKSKAIMVNSPSNPTGRVLTEAEAQAIVNVAVDADLYVISDEIYEKIIFDGREHISLGALPGMAERTITVNGMSKGYAMTGWRLGWMAGPTDVMKVAAKFNSQTATSAATFTQIAGAAALNGPQDAVQMMCESYCERRNFIVNALNEIDNVNCAMIEGAFYIFPSFDTDKDSMAIANVILEEAKVAGVPGSAFSKSGEKHVRFSIASSMEDLEKAVERIANIAHMI